MALVMLTASHARAGEEEKCAAAAESAQRLRAAKHLLDARRQLVLCAQDKCPIVVLRDCATWLHDVESAIPTLSFRARDARGRDLIAVRVLVDGAVVRERLDGTPIEFDPGEHTLRYETAGRAPVEER